MQIGAKRSRIPAGGITHEARIVAGKRRKEFLQRIANASDRVNPERIF
jgi:hypothetical protein